MRKTPAYLKGLAEDRARISGNLEKLQDIYDKIGEKVEKERDDLAACDRMIRRFDSRLEPECIPSIRGWQGRYGKRGALRAAIEWHLKDSWPESITTPQLCRHLELEFSLKFETPAEQRHWVHHSVSNVLKLLARNGTLERQHNLAKGKGINSEVGRWRWRSDNDPSLDQLRVMAEETLACLT